MESHPGFRGVQSAALVAFNVRFNPTACDAVRDGGGMKLMLKAVLMYPNNPSWQLHGWYAIVALLRHGVGQSHFIKLEGTAAIYQTLQSYDSDRRCRRHPGLRSQVFKAFSLVCADEESPRHVDKQTVQLALLSLKTDVGTKSKYCIEALGHLARDARWSTWLSEKRAIGQIVHSMKILLRTRRKPHPSPASHLSEYKAGCVALARLLQKDTQHSLRAIHSVLRAMTPCPKELQVQVHGSAAFASISWSKENVVKASALGACEAVHGAIMMHAKDETTQTQVCLGHFDHPRREQGGHCKTQWRVDPDAGDREFPKCCHCLRPRVEDPQSDE
ncbi:unnamed protein product [Polarella glacialis]|uniref:Uncharacterized protein n=1 Tax=Polarella glacialis TaxID=89957 RepID=A0A813FBA4_POLGL|nr:unnamed protein product [Polarella glacialis]CAE8724242.1 unnamed protein product [Polarella glacialis]